MSSASATARTCCWILRTCSFTFRFVCRKLSYIYIYIYIYISLSLSLPLSLSLSVSLSLYVHTYLPDYRLVLGVADCNPAPRSKEFAFKFDTVGPLGSSLHRIVLVRFKVCRAAHLCSYTTVIALQHSPRCRAINPSAIMSGFWTPDSQFMLADVESCLKYSKYKPKPLVCWQLKTADTPPNTSAAYSPLCGSWIGS